MAAFHGRRVRLPDARRTIHELLALRVPAVTVQRPLRLAAVAAARARHTPRIGWPAIFSKAFGAVAARHPALRQLFVSYPWPHLFQCERNVCTFAVERCDDGAPALHFLTLRSPERWHLWELQATLDRYKTGPAADLAPARRLARLARLPYPLRRLAWWAAYHLAPRWRAKQFGTFGVSAVAAQGAETLQLLSPLTSAVNYSPLEPDGTMRVRLTFDHRVLDGAPAARYLAEVERELCGPILAELRGHRAVSETVGGHRTPSMSGWES